MKLKTPVIKSVTLLMNYKLEKFWNTVFVNKFSTILRMNYKLEKFWNWARMVKDLNTAKIWTINLKSFEIF